MEEEINTTEKLAEEKKLAEVPPNPAINSPFLNSAQSVDQKNNSRIKNSLFPFTKKNKQNKSPFTKGIANHNIKIASLILTIFFVVGISFWLIYKSNKSGILIADGDNSIEILINNKKISPVKQSNGYFVSSKPGQYTLTVKKGGYVSFTQNINLSKGITAKVRPTFTILPSAEKQTIRRFENISFVRPSSDQRSIYFLGDNQQIYRMEVANQVQIKITDNPISNIEDVQWSIDANSAIITQKDGIYMQEINKYDLINQKSVKIFSREAISPVWDPINKNRIAFALYKSNGEQSLIFSDPLMKQLDRKANLAGLNIPNPKLIWSNDSSQIAIIGRSSEYANNNLWIYSAPTGQISQVTKDGYIANASFSPNGKYLLFSKMNKQVESVENIGILNIQNNEVGQIKGINEGVEGIAWKNDTQIFIPKQADNQIKLVNITNGESKKIPFTFSENLTVLGVYYFPENNNLIFYTSDAIYTINISIE